MISDTDSTLFVYSTQYIRVKVYKGQGNTQTPVGDYSKYILTVSVYLPSSFYGRPMERGQIPRRFAMASTTTSSAATPVAMIFSFNDDFVLRALEGLTQEELWRTPTTHNNPML